MGENRVAKTPLTIYLAKFNETEQLVLNIVSMCKSSFPLNIDRSHHKCVYNIGGSTARGRKGKL